MATADEENRLSDFPTGCLLRRSFLDKSTERSKPSACAEHHDGHSWVYREMERRDRRTDGQWNEITRTERREIGRCDTEIMEGIFCIVDIEPRCPVDPKVLVHR